MRKLLTILIACAIVASLMSVTRPSKPTYGDYICWHTSVKDELCGTYGYSKSRKVARKVSEELCAQECDAKCRLEYCEKIKKNRKMKFPWDLL